jgi:hypothetical protein
MAARTEHCTCYREWNRCAPCVAQLAEERAWAHVLRLHVDLNRAREARIGQPYGHASHTAFALQRRRFQVAADAWLETASLVQGGAR